MKSILSVFYRIKYSFILISDKELTCSDSYFPEFSSRRKGRFRIFIEQLYWIWRNGSINDFYFLYGFDIKRFRNQSDYVDYGRFRARREALQHRDNNTQISVLRDKLFFGIVSEALSLRTPRNLSFFEGRSCYVFDTHRSMTIEEYVNTTDVDAFMKLIDGECADGIYKYLQTDGDIFLDGVLITKEDLYKITNKGRFVIQERIVQNDKINKLHPNTVNTVKISTVYDKINDKVEFLPSFFRVGVGTRHVDNWAVGGLLIGVDNETGRLQEWAYYKPGYGTKVKVHPDSNVEFKDFEIPYFKEAKEMVTRYHRILSNVHSIGWDIALLPDGPCIIEGNDNWEISPMQLIHGGMRNEYETLLKLI